MLSGPRIRYRTATPPAPRRILRQRAILDFTGLSQSTIRTLEQTADFPRRLQLGRQAIGWYEDEVFAWLATRPRKEPPAMPTTPEQASEKLARLMRDLLAEHRRNPAPPQQ